MKASNMTKAFKTKSSLRMANGGGIRLPQPDAGIMGPPQKLPVTTGRPVQTNGGVKMQPNVMSIRGAVGGLVEGPGGPREDKVGPVMLSDGEYILPAKTVKKLGGPEELDEIVRETNDGREPGPVIDDEGMEGRLLGGLMDKAKSMFSRTPGAGEIPSGPMKSVDFDPTKATMGQRARSVLRGGGALALGAAAADVAGTETADYEKRLGLDAEKMGPMADASLRAAPFIGPIYSAINPGLGPREQQFAGDLAVRGAGALDTLALGIPSKLFGPKQEEQTVGPVPRTVGTDPGPKPGSVPADQPAYPDEKVGSLLRAPADPLSANTGPVNLGQNIAVSPDASGKFNQFANADGKGSRLTPTMGGFREALEKVKAQEAATAAEQEAGRARRYEEASRGVDRNRINERYDDAIRESGMGKGNTGRRRVELERLRAGELIAQDRNLSEQDINSGKVSALRAGQETQARSDALKMMMDQANKDRQFSLDTKKVGLDEQRMGFDQKNTADKSAMENIDGYTANMFTKPNEKGEMVPDKGMQEGFRRYVFSLDPNFSGRSRVDQRSILEDARKQFEIQMAANAAGGDNWGGGTSSVPQRLGPRRDATLGDLTKGLGVKTYAGSKLRGLTGLGDASVVELGNGQVRASRDLYEVGGTDDLDRLSILRRGSK